MASAACTRKATATEEYPAHYKGVKALVDGGADTIPELYVRPPDDHPVIDSPELQIPLIDLCDLDGPRRAAVVEAIGDACRDWGFFLVKMRIRVGGLGVGFLGFKAERKMFQVEFRNCR
eukprot:TRINITY_DN814_c0_g1_i1.p3 TRINITY_DN814_c0_g1~~TRINITY_DN814_c0_g1_i1.p3  ORF type:complete len:119 (+),score=7.42 TRINITY_DN814_c0_g1_i1:322-678(+)